MSGSSFPGRCPEEVILSLERGEFEEIREKYPCNTEGRWLRIVVASMKERPLVSGKLSSVCVKRLRGSLREEKRDRGLSQA